ncbi:MAG: ABC transporter permease [Anaerolineales bacterium]|nr:ABC transporter permease [Anaerolineales bacterium]
MKASKVVQIAWQGLARNKLRSLLTMLGVIIGVAAVIIMIAISAGTEATIKEQITSLGSNLIYVRSAFSRIPMGMGSSQGGGLVFDDAEAIAEKVNGIQGVVVEMSSSETVKASTVTVEGVTIQGTTPDFPSVRDMTIASGRFFTDAELERKSKVVVLGSTLSEELFGTEDPIGEVITVGDTKMTVIGVFAERGMVGNTDFDSTLYTPITTVFQKFTFSMFARMMGDSVNMIYVELEEGVDMEEVILQITLLLAKRHEVDLDELDFTITTQDDVITTQESTTATFRQLLAWVAAVSLVVGGIGIMNIMLVSVTERTREIGIRQAVGASPGDIRWQFLTEALMLSLLGGLLGVAAGVGGAYLFERLGDLRTVVVPDSILMAFGSAAAVGIFFGFYPANKAAQLDPIEALRHE